MRNRTRIEIEKEAAALETRFKTVKNRTRFAKENGIAGGGSMIYQHIKALKPISLDAALGYAKGFNVPLSEISEYMAELLAKSTAQLKSIPVMAVDDQNGNPDAVQIRKVRLKLRAGICGYETSQETEESHPIFFREDWMAEKGYKPENLIAIKVTGDSMEPGLYEGDVVVINTADTTPVDGKVFAVNYEGEAIVKRLIRDSGKWWLSSDNQDQRKHPRKECTGDYCLIIGRIVHKQSEQI